MVDVKRSNRIAILNLLHEKGGMSRKRISKELLLTPSGITLIVSDMIKEGILREGKTLPGIGSAGRKEVVVDINTHAFCGLGISINLHEVCLSAVYSDGIVLFQKNVPIEYETPVEELVCYLSNELLELVEYNHIEPKSIVGLGVAIRGIIDLEKRKSVRSFGALKEENVPLLQMFQEKTGLQVTLENNVRSLSEAHIFMTHTSRPSSMFFIRSEIGIGGAVTIDSKVHLGGSGKCSELGHIPIVNNGKPCHCGKRGCLETIASPKAIESEIRECFSVDKTPILYTLVQGNPNNISLDLIMLAASSGDMHVKNIVKNAITQLANAIKAIIYIIDPQKIVLYGRMFENKHYLEWLEVEMKIGTEDCSDTIIEKSEFNLTLENKCAGIIAIRTFYNNGGINRIEE